MLTTFPKFLFMLLNFSCTRELNLLHDEDILTQTTRVKTFIVYGFSSLEVRTDVELVDHDPQNLRTK